MARRIPVDVKFPSGKARAFKSVSAVARMLSGNGTASGGLRRAIVDSATAGLFGQPGSTVRRVELYG